MCACMLYSSLFVYILWRWKHKWLAPLLFFWFITPVESIITESLHLLSFITLHLFSFCSQGLAGWIHHGSPTGRQGQPRHHGRQLDDGEGFSVHASSLKALALSWLWKKKDYRAMTITLCISGVRRHIRGATVKLIGHNGKKRFSDKWRDSQCQAAGGAFLNKVTKWKYSNSLSRCQLPFGWFR